MRITREGISKRLRLRVALASTALLLALPAPLNAGQAKPEELLSAPPGGVVRWAAAGAARCGMAGKTFEALDGTCYYPIDVERKPGVMTVTLQNEAGKKQTARVRVEARSYGVEEVDLPDIPQAHPSPDDLKRNERERAMLGKVFAAKEGPQQFTLPLGKPASPLPKGNAFGADRVFDGKPAPQPHMGADYPVPLGSKLMAAADGTVVVAE